MGEWSYQHYDRPCDIVDIATMQPVMSVDANEADMAIEAHNADIAAYEARIAALEGELARVKAESLRVVPDGEARHPGSIGDFFPLLTIEGYLGIQYSDEELILLAGPNEEMLGFCDIHPDTIVQPVRLERWEATNDHH